LLACQLDSLPACQLASFFACLLGSLLACHLDGLIACSLSLTPRFPKVISSKKMNFKRKTKKKLKFFWQKYQSIIIPLVAALFIGAIILPRFLK
jgi:hypothetical protein